MSKSCLYAVVYVVVVTVVSVGTITVVSYVVLVTVNVAGSVTVDVVCASRVRVIVDVVVTRVNAVGPSVRASHTPTLLSETDLHL